MELKDESPRLGFFDYFSLNLAESSAVIRESGKGLSDFDAELLVGVVKLLLLLGRGCLLGSAECDAEGGRLGEGQSLKWSGPFELLYSK